MGPKRDTDRTGRTSDRRDDPRVEERPEGHPGPPADPDVEVRASEDDAPPLPEEDGAPGPEEDRPSRSEVDRTPPSEEILASAPEEESRVTALIEAGEELDEPEAREDLIAAVAGMGEATEDELETEDGAAVGDDASGEAGRAGAPVIGADALVALDQFRDEAVASTREELVLELGSEVTEEERDRLLAATLAHVQMQEAIYRVPTGEGTGRRWKGLVATLLFVVALFTLALPPAFLVPASPQPLSSDERLRGLRAAILVQSQQIEAFRAREERLPGTLEEVETALPEIRFVRSDDRVYQLVGYARDGTPVIYDSAAPDAAFEEAGHVLGDGSGS